MPDSARLFNIFIVYAREDRESLKALRKKLAPLVRGNRVNVWFDAEITGGKIWEEA